MSKPKAVVLLSGGLDSATVLAMAMSQGFDAYAMSFRYGQRHVVELEKAKEVALQLGATRHIIVDIDLRAFGGSALTRDIAVPKGRSAADMAHGIPSTYVPARNTIFLSFALAWAEVVGSGDIFVGVNALDYSGYPDCRPEYIEAFERMANLATKAGVEGTHKLKIHAPLIKLSKAGIVKAGTALGVDFSITSSCYDPGAKENLAAVAIPVCCAQRVSRRRECRIRCWRNLRGPDRCDRACRRGRTCGKIRIMSRGTTRQIVVPAKAGTQWRSFKRR
jgi:7-cyano-7-deazaguanine synthase